MLVGHRGVEPRPRRFQGRVLSLITPMAHDRVTRAVAGIEAATRGFVGPPPYQLAYTTYPHSVFRNPSPTATNASSRAGRSSITVGIQRIELCTTPLSGVHPHQRDRYRWWSLSPESPVSPGRHTTFAWQVSSIPSFRSSSSSPRLAEFRHSDEPPRNQSRCRSPTPYPHLARAVAGRLHDRAERMVGKEGIEPPTLRRDRVYSPAGPTNSHTLTHSCYP